MVCVRIPITPGPIYTMHIVLHKLAGVQFREATSYGSLLRAATVIVAHDTASVRPGSSVEWFSDPECTVSAHVVIERDGTITQMVPFDRMAYHAGESTWNGKRWVNTYGIGIELMNPGMMQRRADDVVLVYPGDKIVGRFPVRDCLEVQTPEHGHGWCLPYTPEQIEAFREVCFALVKTYPSIQELLTHWLISPGRKVDTTPLFPLADIRRDLFPPAQDNEAPPMMALSAINGDTTSAGVTYSVDGPAVAPTKAGLFDGFTFAKINELADEGSRIAATIQKFKRWLTVGAVSGGAGAAAIDTDKGTGAILKAIVLAHPLLALFLAAAAMGLAMWIALKKVEKYVVTAAKDGRYQTRKGEQ